MSNDPTGHHQSPLRRRSVGPTCASDLVLDRIALGETTEAERSAVAAHLGTCPACTAASARLEADRAAFAREAAIANLAVDVLARSQRETKQVWKRVLLRRLLAPVLMGAAVAGISLFVKSNKPETRTKGEFSLSTYVLHPETHAPGSLHLGEPLHPGDKLEFRLNGAPTGYVAIVSVDSAGQVSSYYPPIATAAPVQSGRDVSLDSAVELDGTLGREVIIGLRCETAVPIATITAATQKAVSEARGRGGAPTDLGALGLPCAEARHLIEKRPLPAP